MTSIPSSIIIIVGNQLHTQLSVQANVKNKFHCTTVEKPISYTSDKGMNAICEYLFNQLGAEGYTEKA